MTRGLANAQPTGSAKFANAPPPGTYKAGKCQAVACGGGGGRTGHRWNWLCIRISLSFHIFLQVVILLLQVYNWEIRHHSLVCHRGLADILYILVSFFKLYFQYATSLRHASKTRVELFLLSQSCRDLTRYEARYENTTTTTTNK